MHSTESTDPIAFAILEVAGHVWSEHFDRIDDVDHDEADGLLAFDMAQAIDAVLAIHNVTVEDAEGIVFMTDFGRYDDPFDAYDMCRHALACASACANVEVIR